MDLNEGRWLNEPASWAVEGGTLRATTGARTDFWRETFYGFTRDSGHFLAFPAPDAFTATVRLVGAFETLYDQAGLMLRQGEQHWLKCGVEFTDGRLHLSTVVTDRRSDWSMTPSPHGPDTALWLRLTLSDGAVRIQASFDGRDWSMLRLAPFAATSDGGGGLEVGPMLCSPERAGLEVTFTDFAIGPPITTGLHEPG